MRRRSQSLVSQASFETGAISGPKPDPKVSASKQATSSSAEERRRLCEAAEPASPVDWYQRSEWDGSSLRWACLGAPDPHEIVPSQQGPQQAAPVSHRTEEPRPG